MTVPELADQAADRDDGHVLISLTTAEFAQELEAIHLTSNSASSA